MRLTKSHVFEQMNMDVNSPMEDTIGGIYADVAEDIRFANPPLQQIEIERRVLLAARREVRSSLTESGDLMKYIVLSAQAEILERESPYENMYVGRIPDEPHFRMLQSFERILGHATESIIHGVLGNLSEMGLYHKRRQIRL